MRYCKDCKHSKMINTSPACFQLLGLSVLFDEVMGCDVEGMIDPVDGEKLYRKCGQLRKAGGKCGPQGDLWTPKEP